MLTAVTLTAAELVDLTGYRQHARQANWLESVLRIRAPRRADGMPIVSRAQIEAALSGQRATAGPNWSRLAT